MLQGWSDYPQRPRRAFVELVDDMRSMGADLELSETQLSAVEVLLYIRNSVTIHGREQLCPATHVQRARLASELLRRPKFRDRTNRSGEDPSTPESRLLEAFTAALDDFNPRPSVTQAYGWTARNSQERLSSVSRDLLGTWKGLTISDWHIKAEGRRKSGSFTCFMVIDLVSGELRVNWFFPAGVVYASAVRLTQESEGRRLSVIYESTGRSRQATQTPDHRGAAVLEATATPATLIEGPYWTDRQTNGTLTFNRRVPAKARSFDEAAALFVE
jgi:hypothetical protein